MIKLILCYISVAFKNKIKKIFENYLFSIRPISFLI